MERITSKSLIKKAYEKMVVVDAEGGGDVGDEEEGDGPNDGIAATLTK